VQSAAVFFYDDALRAVRKLKQTYRTPFGAPLALRVDVPKPEKNLHC
jgi:hypothetical protein